MSQSRKTYNILTIIALIVVAVAALTAWQLYSGNTNPTNNDVRSAVDLKKTSDTTGLVRFTFPGNWKVADYTWQPCCEGEVMREPDWSKNPQPITLKPFDANPNVQVQVHINNGVSNDYVLASTIDEAWQKRTVDQFNTYEKLKINGYDALYTKLDFVGPSEVEAYTDHRYLVTHDGKSVEFYFRQKYRHDWNGKDDPAVNFDASEYLDDFQLMVNSIEFMK